MLVETGVRDGLADAALTWGPDDEQVEVREREE